MCQLSFLEMGLYHCRAAAQEEETDVYRSAGRRACVRHPTDDFRIRDCDPNMSYLRRELRAGAAGRKPAPLTASFPEPLSWLSPEPSAGRAAGDAGSGGKLEKAGV